MLIAFSGLPGTGKTTLARGIAQARGAVFLRIDTIEQALRDAGFADAAMGEVICSDRAEHRRRVETRITDVAGLKLPTWREVETREYEPWDETAGRPHIVIDTAGRSVAESLGEIRQWIENVPVG